jgi:hypothetical protein
VVKKGVAQSVAKGGSLDEPGNVDDVNGGERGVATAAKGSGGHELRPGVPDWDFGNVGLDCAKRIIFCRNLEKRKEKRERRGKREKRQKRC